MPEWITSLAFVLIGFAGLIGGGESLVRSASALAAIMRVSPLVIGLTVVAFGTSAPELAVTLQSAWAGAPDLAVGNVVGSNIANVLLVLGVASLVAPIAAKSRIVRIDIPLMIAASLGLWLLARNGRLGWIDGSLLVSMLGAYLAWSVWQGKRETSPVQEELAEAAGVDRAQGRLGLLRELGVLLIGLLLLSVGARLLVMGAVDLALVFGVGELVVGLTIVAVGTSLPEVVTSVIAGLRGKGDIALGNIVGSNLFNILAVLGLGSILAPKGIPVSQEALTLDIPIMIAAALACLPVLFTGMRVDRWEGGIFLALYGAYIAYLVLRATDSSLVRPFEVGMLVVLASVVPIAVWHGLRPPAQDNSR